MKYVALITTSILLTIILLVSLWSLPEQYVTNINNKTQQNSPALTKLQTENLKNDLRKLILAAFAGIATAAGFILTFWQIRNLEENLKLAQIGQWNERYGKAIELVSSEKPEIRFGGVYALISLSSESAIYQSPITRVLCSYIIEKYNTKSRIPPKRLTPRFYETMERQREQVPLDLEAVLEYIGTLPANLDGRKGRKSAVTLRFLDLAFYEFASLDLSGSLLAEVDISHTSIFASNFDRTSIHTVLFNKSRIEASSFRGSAILKTHFNDSVLVNCSFRSAIVFNTDFSNANLWGVDFSDSNLNNVNFKNNNLAYADFRDAHISNKETLFEAHTLFNAQLDRDYLEMITSKKPELLEEPKDLRLPPNLDK